MSSFKEQLEHDNTSVFINAEEFGEEHSIDGELLTVVIDNDLIHERPALSTSGVDFYAEGVYLSTITFFVEKYKLGYIPVENQQMRFDDYPCIVKRVSESFGMLEITLDANRT